MTSSRLPDTLAVAAETTPHWSRRRRRLWWGRTLHASVPYWLILPVVAAIGLVLGYPLYSLVRLSLQHYTLFELIQHHGQWIGLANFSSVLHDQVFWHTLLDESSGRNPLPTLEHAATADPGIISPRLSKRSPTRVWCSRGSQISPSLGMTQESFARAVLRRDRGGSRLLLE